MPLDEHDFRTVDQRKALYRRVRSFIDSGAMSWDHVFRGALRGKQFGKGYIDNFRAGKISRLNALAIDAYLDSYFGRPTEKIPQDPLVFPSAQGTTSRLELLDPATGARFPPHGMPDSPQWFIAAGTYFTLQVYGPFSGEAVAVRWFQKEPFPLRLGSAGFRAPLAKGFQRLPQEGPDTPSLLRLLDVGVHTFELIMVEGEFVFDPTRGWRVGEAIQDYMVATLSNNLSAAPTDTYSLRFFIQIT